MLWDPLRVLFTPYLYPTTLWLSWLPDPSKALAIQTLPGLSWLPSTAPTPQFGGQGYAGNVYSQPGGDSWSCPCWGIPPAGDTGVAQLLLCHKQEWPQCDRRRQQCLWVLQEMGTGRERRRWSSSLCEVAEQGSVVTAWGQDTGMGEGRKVKGKPGRTAIPLEESG